MAELTLTTFLSLDGVMQAPGGPHEDESGGFPHGGWVFPLFDDDMGRTIIEIFSKADAFLLGRGTYDIFAAHWPRVTDPNDPIAAGLNALPKFVASRTRSSFPWNNSTHVARVPEDAADLKQRFKREVQVHGSAGLAQTLMQNDLIDEYRLFTFPVTLGTGKRLFGSGAVPRTLKLVSSSMTSRGIVISVYRPAGKLVTGSFALE
ncbi:MAG TPA: dihydrofolate reductase family protein [Nitrospirota bacterium]|nr:dihydrofolate reductase family protein [Nitrospirota bacterium]